ncbi:MAG TPA: OmpA family protein [Gemmatimonadales bacterium]|nr:OmpA family protein [Gemmatimonadales bacterium]
MMQMRTPMRTWLTAAGMGLLTLTAAACGHKPEPETPTPVATATPAPGAGAGSGASTDDAAAREAAARRAAARATLAEVIRFGYDRADLSADAQATLDRKADALRSYADVQLAIGGHTDERGSDEYNLALGNRRAAAAKRYLVNRGVDAARLATESFGEERPAVEGHDESAWAANRRAEFTVSAGELAAQD